MWLLVSGVVECVVCGWCACAVVVVVCAWCVCGGGGPDHYAIGRDCVMVSGIYTLMVGKCDEGGKGDG